MKKYILKRLLSFFIVIIGASILSFLLITFSGKDPAQIIALRGSVNVSEEMINQIRVEMGFDRPLLQRYFSWIGGMFTGKLGISIYTFNPIVEDLKQRLPTTFALVGLSLIWIIIISFPLSILCARYKNGIFDQIVRVITLIGICLPAFWLGYILLMVFAVNLSWFRVLPEPGLRGLILPSLAMAVPSACSMIRLFRASLLTNLSSDYVQYAKARGVSSKRILVNHVIRNSLPPIVTVFCQYLGFLIAGSAVVENVFTLNGLGSYLIGCVSSADAQATATCILIVAAIFVVSNLLGDIANRLLCPWMVRETND